MKRLTWAIISSICRKRGVILIRLKPLASLKAHVPSLDGAGCFAIEYRPGMTVSDALNMTDIPAANVKYSVLVNNVRRKHEDPLQDDDVLTIMPLLAGG